LNPRQPPLLIVNADDLGYSPPVNQAIETALERDWIRSATLMANAPSRDEGAAIAERHGARAGFGIHLNLTEFQPLTDPAGAAALGLLNDAGAFGDTIRQLRPSRELREFCHHELDSQIRMVQSLGVAISHLDSHHHIHTIPWLLPVIQRLQKQHGIRRMRTTMNVYGHRLHTPPPLKRVLGKRLWKAACRLRGSHLTDVFTGMDVFVEDSTRPEFRRCRSIELMCHPGQEGYNEELPLLERCRALVSAGGYRFASFRDLAGG